MYKTLKNKKNKVLQQKKNRKDKKNTRKDTRKITA